MKKIVTFDKSLEFSKMIGEVTSIELEHTLKFVDGSDIEGDFLINGTYKMTEASQLEEKFNYKIPVDIALTEELELDTSKIEIDDFYYEIENDDTMICHIDVRIEGVEHIEEVPDVIEKEDDDNIQIEVREENSDVEEERIDESKDEVVIEEILDDGLEVKEIDEIQVLNINRECDGDNNSDDSCEIEIKEEKDNNMSEKIKEEVSDNVGSLFSSLKDSEETFSTYSVYILRSEETVESIISKYKVTKEDLENYNDLSNLSVGSKVIIPTVNE